jgi:hypothetical protein
MATQIVMDHTGDTRHQFDPADAAVSPRLRQASRSLRARASLPRNGQAQDKARSHRDPVAEETLFIPRLRGG